MKHFFLFLVLCTSLGLSSCKHGAAGSYANQKSEAYVGTGVFVGCVPTPSECRYSCPERNGEGQIDANLCPDSQSPVACRCPGDSSEDHESAIKDTHDFVSCDRSPSECRYTCMPKGLATFKGSARCQDSALPFACFCAKN